MRLLSVFILLPLLCSAADELTLLRDHQDRKALEAKAAALDAAAQKKAHDAQVWYQGALAYSYAAEVAMEQGDKGGAKRFAEAGVTMADKAIEINYRNA